ncbi:MAG: twin-arginine translocase TatA/TatE family subunit [Bdellovibrionales bacterium]|jgi:sec-independent protein translocase protein TatA|nr:twin-arginine translocase TatA/TatE family subunit [Bdellovibrionales bacterium]MBT3527293.1 twin-arginine translocase TatA/TatE family subunit [Bdellovibrionales bacterium]MBT7766347.1 twin-arginine translocase TatA/TatE family subunit [Bdellovibrionales bacterium]
MFGLGMGELVVLLIVVVFLFGGKKLPQLGSAMGKALVNFKQGLKSAQDDKDEVTASKESDQNPPTS